MSTRELIAQKLIADARDALATGKINQARGLLKKSFETFATYQSAFMIALTYARQDNVKSACSYFRRATEIDPANPEGHYNLGYSYQLLKDYKAASSAYENAIRLDPEYHQALHNLGVAYREEGRFDDAIECLKKALNIKPDSTETFYNLGYVYLKLNQYGEALSALNKVLDANPNHAKALNNRGLVNVELHRFRDAINDFSSAIAIDPDDLELLLNKAKAASAAKQIEIAVAAYRQYLKLNPDHVEAQLDYAFNLERLNKYSEASVIFEKLLRKDPEITFLLGYCLSARFHVCDWHGYENSVREILGQIENGKQPIVPHSVTLIPSKRSHQKQAAELTFKQISNLSDPSRRRPRIHSNERIKVGYFSPDFHAHPVGILIAPLFEKHNRDKFEIFAFSMGSPTRDATRLRIESGVEHFINVREMSDSEIIELAAQQGLDIAIDLSGHTAGNRFPMFCKGLAPIQVNFLGYSATLGVKQIHYIIGDQTLIPCDHDADYTEKVIRLPHSYMPTDPMREISSEKVTREQYNLPENGFIFCGFNNAYKICPEQFDLWMEILRGVEDSVIWLSPVIDEAKINLRKEASNRGVDPNRLVFANREERLSVHLARHRLADLFLDTLPHNAHATSNDALLAGLPILTRLGEGFAARVAGSLVTAAGMPEMIMPDSEAYVRRAIEIAKTPGLSQSLKQELASKKKTAPLFNIQQYTRDLEKAFIYMNERRLNGLPPESFDVR